jgi:predicted metal-binding membrane protein
VVVFALSGALMACAAGAWWWTVNQSRSMQDMVSGLGQVGRRAPNDIAIPLLMVMWVLMMVAMMFPTIAPIVLTHRRVMHRRGAGEVPTAAFVAGYLVVWSLFGIVPLAAFLGFRNLTTDASDSRSLAVLAGGVLVVAGAYQFTRWKTSCARACLSPLAFVVKHDFGTGAPGAFRAGVVHGGYCLGCCWALMSVLLVFGLMNLAWMAAITVVFLFEKSWVHGTRLARVVGAALIVVGLAVVIDPGLLPTISGAGGSPKPMMPMG